MGSDDDSQTTLLSGIRSAFSRNKRSVSQEEFLEMVDDNEELLEDEKRMIGEILSLDDLTAAEIMQPRVDIIAVEDIETVRDALDRMQGTGYSRLPVYHEDLDHIVGIINYKDVVPAVLDGNDDDPASEFMCDVLFVPETKDVLPLLSEMQTSRKQMAIVIDEYGGTDGLVTIEDIVEEIVGEIIDETDSEAPELQLIGPFEWLVDGRYPIEDLQELGWPVEESDQYETIAGWLIDTIDKVPGMGDEFEIGGFVFKVRSMRRRRIKTILVKGLDGSDDTQPVTQTSRDNALEEA